MPIELPDLDDRRYSDLMEEALRMIPAHAPEWTNHNPSDPGITLIELFAYLTEMLIFRLNRVTPEATLAFLKLINGPDWMPCRPEADAKAWSKLELRARDTEIRAWWRASSLEERGRIVAETVRRLRRPVRAVSGTDFEALARAADERVARVHCIPGHIDGHIRLIVVPDPEKTGGFDLPPDLKGEEGKAGKIHSALRDRCLLATRLDVEGPTLAEVSIQLTLVLESDTPEQDAHTRADRAFRGFLDPLTWPFGQAIALSRLTALFADLPGIHDVRGIQLSVIPAMPPVKDPLTGNTIAMPIAADALAIAKVPMKITIERVGA